MALSTQFLCCSHVSQKIFFDSLCILLFFGRGCRKPGLMCYFLICLEHKKLRRKRECGSNCFNSYTDSTLEIKDETPHVKR